jgi:hypothetical protein
MCNWKEKKKSKGSKNIGDKYKEFNKGIKI